MNVPRLQFKNDDGWDFPEWEEKSLGDFCNITTGKSNRHRRLLACNTDIDFVAVISTDAGTKPMSLLPVSVQISFFHSKFVRRKRL
jgi:hypothetical protein